MEENTGNPDLASDAIPIGSPLEWPIVDSDGTLLLAQGVTLSSAAQRDFLCGHFHPRRGDLAEQAASPAAAPEAPPPANEARPANVDSMRLPIGALLGVRPQVGMGRAMHSSRVIGFAPNHALFVTAPLLGGQPLPLGRGEQVEVVAMATQAVFWFLCTVDAICKDPFNYVVLSQPGNLRLLRERKSMRVPVHLALRYGTDMAAQAYDGLGMVRDISSLGMSLATAQTLGQAGDRLRVAFRIRDNDLDIDIEAIAIIRNVQSGTAANANLSLHGLEFEHLEGSQQIALKAFVFDRQDITTTQWSAPA